MLIQLLLATAAFVVPDDFRDYPERHWNFAELARPPEYRVCPEPAAAYKDLKPLLVKGRGLDGGEAEFFCYFAKPADTVPVGGYPGVLLVHGGGGTAFPYNVDKWREAGFAVLAPDWYNQIPAPGLTNAVPKEPQTPRLSLPGGKYSDSDPKVVRVNVSNLTLAHSLLRSLPDVNPSKIVYVGLSWGSWYGATLTALDSRFCGVVEIYCGDARPIRPYGPGGGLVAGRFLHVAKCPTWWVVGTNDGVMTPASAQTAFEECPLHYGHAIVPRLPHSHIGFEFESVMRMARHFACGGPSLPILGRSTVSDGVVSARITTMGVSVGRAVLHYTKDPECPDAKRWCERAKKRKWLEVPAEVNGDVVSAKIPENARQAFLSLYENDEGRFHDLCGSSDVIDFP